MIMVRVIIVSVIVIVTALDATLIPVRMFVHKFASIHANYL
jgi:hypothetical protein